MTRVREFATGFARLAVGFVVAPVSVGLVFAGVAYVLDGKIPVLLIVLTIYFGYPVAIVFGIPLHMILSCYGWRSLRVYAICGAFLGVGPYLMPVLVPRLLGTDTSNFGDMLFYNIPGAIAFMVIGAVSSSVFWMIVIWRSPSP